MSAAQAEAQRTNEQLKQLEGIDDARQLRGALLKHMPRDNGSVSFDKDLLKSALKDSNVHRYSQLKAKIRVAWKGALVLGVLACISEVLPLVLTHVSMSWLPAISVLGMSAGVVSIAAAAALTFVGVVGLGLAINYIAERYKVWSQFCYELNEIEQINYEVRGLSDSNPDHSGVPDSYGIPNADKDKDKGKRYSV